MNSIVTLRRAALGAVLLEQLRSRAQRNGPRYRRESPCSNTAIWTSRNRRVLPDALWAHRNGGTSSVCDGA